MIIRHQPAVDMTDGVALRIYLESLRQWLSTERASWDTQYADLARFFLPRSPRFNYADVDTGYRQDYSIVDNTATQALGVLAAGIFSSVSSPTREWYRLRMSDDALNDNPEVKDWLDEAQEALGQIFVKSNFYQTLLKCYSEEALYGTTAFFIAEDREDVIRCHPYPVGSYYVSGDDALRIDLVMRVVSMTNRQLVDRFGYKNVSQAMRTYYDSNAGGMKEQWFPVVHVITKNRYFDYTLDNQQMPWTSIYYELSNYDNTHGILARSGFNEFPVMVGRWTVTGENFYGDSAAMNCLGDTMALQLLQKRKSQAIDRQTNPPLVADPSLANQNISVLPGQVTFASMRDGAPGIKPVYQVDLNIQSVLEDIREHQGRINGAMFKDLFLMNSQSDRRQITAEEIRARQEEKMLVLGPVAERNNDEILKPAILRALMIAFRRGKLPQLPQVMQGKPFKIEFESILAQANRIMRTANIDRLMAFLGSEVAINQSVLDNFDLDEMAIDYAGLLGVPPKIVRPKEEIATIRQSKQEQMAAQQRAENAQKLAQAGLNLSKTDVGSDSALTRLMPALGQPAGAP